MRADPRDHPVPVVPFAAASLRVGEGQPHPYPVVWLGGEDQAGPAVRLEGADEHQIRLLATMRTLTLPVGRAPGNPFVAGGRGTQDIAAS